MDEVIQIGMSELALEGAQGCHLERFFDLIQLRISSASSIFLLNLKFDDKMKEYLFGLLKSLKDVSVRQEDEIKLLDFSDRKFQKKTFLIASKNLQNAELGMDVIDITWTDQLKRIFEKITSSRENGITQAQLAKDEVLDPRSCFHYIKILVQARVCVKIPILAAAGNGGSKLTTNLILHTKFKNTSPAYISFTRKRQHMERIGSAESLFISKEPSHLDDALQHQDLSTRIDRSVIIEKMRVLLESAKNNVLRLDDFMNALMDTSKKSRKYLGSIVGFFKKGGYVKTFDVPNHTKGKGFISCIQMIKPLPTTGDEKLDDEKDIEPNSTFYFKSDLPLETQVLNLITQSGSTGINSTKLMEYFSPYLSYKVLMKVIGTLQGQSRSKNDSKRQKAYIKSVYDFDGKIRNSRYFSLEVVNTKEKKTTSKKGKEIIRDADPLKCIHCPKYLDLNMKGASSLSGFCSKECETIFLLGTAPSADSASKSGTHALASKSMTSLRKSKYTENIIERMRIVEVNNQLYSLIDEESAANGETVKYQTDRKTLDRILKTLQEQKKINVIEASMTVLGRKRRFITLPSIKADHTEFQEFLKVAAEERTKLISSYSSKANREIQMDIEVESMKRVEESIDEEPEPPVAMDSNLKISDKTMDSLNSNELFAQTLLKNEDSGWNEIAIKYGYIAEKYQRAKLLHQWLFEISWNNDHILSTVNLFDSFPLQLYCEVVGMRKNDMRLDQIAGEEKFSIYSLSNIPDGCKHLIVNHYWKRSLASLMHALEIFGFIECLEMKDEKYLTIPSQEHNLVEYYRILREVPRSIDFFEGSFSSEKCKIIDLDQLKHIWEKLRGSVKLIDSGQKKDVHSKFRGILILRNWESPGLSAHQKQTLLKLTNPNNGSTPLQHNQLCNALAAKLNLDLDAVKKFYTEFEAKYKRSKRKQEKNDRKDAKNRISLKKANLKFQISSNQKKKEGENTDGSQFFTVLNTFSRADLKTKRPLVKDESSEIIIEEPPKAVEMPAVPASSLAPYDSSKGIRRKANWSAEEDDLLCYGYVVILKNQKGRGVSSQLARKLMPNRMDIHPDAPRRRINQLKDQVDLQEKFQFIASQWEPFQQEAKKNNQWYANVSKDNLDASYLVLCEEFRNFCNDRKVFSGRAEQADRTIKDKSGTSILVDETEQMGHVIVGRDHLVSDNSTPIDEGLEARSSRAGKFAFLNTMSFSIPKSESMADFDYATIDATDIRFGLAVGLLKIIMLISDESYNAEQAFNALKENFDDSVVATALDMLKSLSTATRAQRSQNVSDRRVPGRACQISEKALSLLNGSYSKDFLVEARNYWKLISSSTFSDTDLPEYYSPGIMAVITDVFTSAEYNLEIAEEISATYEGPVNDIQIRLKKILLAAEYIGKKRKKDESEAPLKTKKGRKANDFSVEDPICNSEAIINRLGKENSIREAYLKEIYRSISAGGFMGKNIKEINDDLEDVWARSDLETMISLLLSAKTIEMVGVDHPRYICAQYELDWTIFVKKDSKSDFIHPYMWNELDGTVNQPLYDQCLDSVFQIILQKPGITEKNLHKKFYILFGKMELHRILEDLISKGRISKFATYAPERTTGLLDGLFSKEVDEEAFQEEVTSFAVPSFKKAQVSRSSQKTMTISPSSLQTFNNELVKGLESLKDQRGTLVKQISIQQKEALSLEEQIEQLSQKLNQITQDLNRKTALKEEYDRLIQETETAYCKIVESSQTLLKVMNTEANHLQNC